MTGYTTIKTICEVCGVVDLTAADILRGRDHYRFTHCGIVNEKKMTSRIDELLRAVGVRELLPPRCSCGLAMFTVGRASACRNCDAPMPGLPPADRRGFVA